MKALIAALAIGAVVFTFASPAHAWCGTSTATVNPSTTTQADGASAVAETTGPPPIESGVAARSDTLPATGQDHWILIVMAVTLIVTGALCLIKVRLTRKEEGR